MESTEKAIPLAFRTARDPRMVFPFGVSVYEQKKKQSENQRMLTGLLTDRLTGPH